MARGNWGRVAVAVALGYIANTLLVIAAELLLRLLAPGIGKPSHYFTVDLIIQSFCTIGAGYLACVVAGSAEWRAMGGLMILGVLIGSAFLVTSWKAEPHGYVIGLLLVFPPCVWAGWMIRAKMIRRSPVDR